MNQSINSDSYTSSYASSTDNLDDDLLSNKIQQKLHANLLRHPLIPDEPKESIITADNNGYSLNKICIVSGFLSLFFHGNNLMRFVWWILLLILILLHFRSESLYNPYITYGLINVIKILMCICSFINIITF